MAPAYRPDLCDGSLDIQIIGAGMLARTRLFAATATGTVGRCRVYHAWQSGSADLASADTEPVWVSIDGEVATAESSIRHAKRERGLLVYRQAAQ